MGTSGVVFRPTRSAAAAATNPIETFHNVLSSFAKANANGCCIVQSLAWKVFGAQFTRVRKARDSVKTRYHNIGNLQRECELKNENDADANTNEEEEALQA